MGTNKIYIDLNFNASGSTGAVTSLVKNQRIKIVSFFIFCGMLYRYPNGNEQV